MALGCSVGVALLGVLGVALNGLTSPWETPRAGTTAVPARASSGTLRVVAYNVAKLGVRRGLSFRSREAVEADLDAIAALIRRYDPDLVVLSEVVVECTPCDVDQVRTLAEATGMHAWAWGENATFGLPGCRLRTGNAVLSRLPLRATSNLQLAGARSVLWPVNNRRVLWCDVQVADAWLPIAAVHLDSRDDAVNLTQVGELLDQLGDRPGILAGDFNAKPYQAQLARLRNSGRFSGAFDGAPTAPASAPEVRIDYVFAPATWEHLRTEVVDSQLSDHRPVFSEFRLP